jgi:ABC-type multidrug transport system ATPase subunit
MDEADRCDRIALVQRGRILAIDSPSAIGSRFPHPLVSVRGERRYAMLRALRGHEHTASVFPFGDDLHYSDARAGLPADEVARETEAWLIAEGFANARVEPIVAGVEDTFMALMGGPEVAA